MNQDQMMSLVRAILQIIGTSVVAHGTFGVTGAASIVVIIEYVNQ